MTTTLAMKDLRHIRDLAKDSKVCEPKSPSATWRAVTTVLLCVSAAALHGRACNKHCPSCLEQQMRLQK